MKGLKKRLDDLEQANGETNWIMLAVHRTADGRIRHGGQVYANTDALRKAKGIPPDTAICFVYWNFDLDPAEKPCYARRMEEKADHKEHVDCPPASNPFISPVTPALTSEQLFADAPSTVWGPNGLLKHFDYP